jgi:putative transposase
VFTHEHNLVRSVGRTAVCWDNAQAESFWATLKVEFYDRYLWPTKVAAKVAEADAGGQSAAGERKADRAECLRPAQPPVGHRRISLRVGLIR